MKSGECSAPEFGVVDAVQCKLAALLLFLGHVTITVIDHYNRHDRMQKVTFDYNRNNRIRNRLLLTVRLITVSNFGKYLTDDR